MLDTEFEIDIKNCVEVLKNGGIILYPTDTIWGIGCDATNENAVDKVYALKQRPSEKSMIVLLAEAKDIFKYVAAPPPDIIAIEEGFVRPTTVIYENALGLASNVIKDDWSIGIRVTDDLFCKALIKRFGKPIVSTSANLSGDTSPSIYKEINSAIVTGVDYVVRYRQEDVRPAAPSRLIKINDEGAITVLRG